MTDIVRSADYLLTSEFQDGQSAGSITAQRVRDFVVSVVDGGMITPKSTNSSTARSLSARFGDVINVLDWLTAGQPDGTTDNTTQLQAAINAGAGTAIVYFPKVASPYITTQLSVPSNSHLIIDGTIMGIAGGGGSVQAVITTPNAASSNIVIEGSGIIDGNKANVAARPNGFGGIVPYLVTNMIIRGLTVQHTTRSGISLDCCINVLVDGCYMTDNGNSNQMSGVFNGRPYNLCYNCWFKNCRIDTVTDMGFAFYNGNTHCGISNCVISGVDSTNAGIAVFSDTAVTGQAAMSDHITIADNIVFNCGAGINITIGGGSGTNLHTFISVTGNQISATTNGAMFLRNCKFVNICNNMMEGSLGNVGGVQVGPTLVNNVMIANNTITGVSGPGIYIPGASKNVSILGNSLSNNYSANPYGVLLAATNVNTLISNNMFFDDQGSPTMTDGIRGPAGTGLVMTGNTMTSNLLRFYPATISSDTILEQPGNKIRVVTAAGGITHVFTDEIILVNKTSGAATAVTLMASPPTGQAVTISDGKGDANTNNITISPAAGTINGASTFVLSQAYASANLIYNGTQWNVT